MENKLEFCPFCQKHAVYIGVHDDEGNYRGKLGCDYESDPWSGLSYGLHHEGWGECVMCTNDMDLPMGGILFDTAEEAAEAWNKGVGGAIKELIKTNFGGCAGCANIGLRYPYASMYPCNNCIRSGKKDYFELKEKVGDTE